MKKRIKRIEEKFALFYDDKFNKIEFAQNILFFIGLTLLILYQTRYNLVIFHFEHDFYVKIIPISIFCFLAKIIITKEKLSTYFRFLVYILISYLIESHLGEEYYLTTIILPIIAARNINIKSIIRYIFTINITVLCVRISVYVLNEFFGLELFDLFVRRYFRRGDLIRHTFYFNHPNTFSNFIFWTFMMYIYLNFEDKQKKNSLILLSVALGLFVYVFPNSRTAALLFWALALLLWIYNNNNKIRTKKAFKFVNIWSFPLLFVFAFVLFYLQGQDNIIGDITSAFDMFITGRIRIARAFYNEYGISLLGVVPTTIRNKLVLGAGNTGFVVDNWYYYLAIRNGLIMVIFYAYHFPKTIHALFMKKDYAKIFVLGVFMIAK